MNLKVFWEKVKSELDPYKTLSLSVFTITLSSVFEVIIDDEFVCPCVTREEASAACGITQAVENSTLYCVSETNALLSFMFMSMPAIILFALVAVISTKWKSLVGLCCCCSKVALSRFNHQQERDARNVNGKTCRDSCIDDWPSRFSMSCCGRSVMVPLLATATWLVAAFLDGRYFACFYTPLPYDLPVDGKCKQVMIVSRNYWQW